MKLRATALAFVLGPTLVAPSLAETLVQRVQRGVEEPNGSSASPAVAGDGRSVVFRSNATNIVTNGAGGSLLRLDLPTRSITTLTPDANGSSDRPAVSADGRYVAFETNATNLGDSSNGQGADVLRLDRENGQFRHASRALLDAPTNAAAQAPAISADGRFVAFTSYATNLVAPAPSGGLGHLYQMDFQTGSVSLLDQTAQGVYANKDISMLEANAMSADGNRIVFTTGAENLATVNAGNVSDVLVRTRNAQTGAVSFENVNRSVAGAVGTLSSSRGSISPNGRHVVFRSAATNISAVPSMSAQYVRDLDHNTLRTVPLPAGYQTCDRARVTDLGDVLMQCSPLAPATAIQLFLAPANGSEPRLVSRNVVGFPGNQSSSNAFTISADGNVVAFESAATDLVALDANSSPDVFLSGDARLLDGLFNDSFE